MTLNDMHTYIRIQRLRERERKRAISWVGRGGRPSRLRTDRVEESDTTEERTIYRAQLTPPPKAGHRDYVRPAIAFEDRPRDTFNRIARFSVAILPQFLSFCSFAFAICSSPVCATRYRKVDRLSFAKGSRNTV